MIELSLSEIATLCNARQPTRDVTCRGISIDSRHILPGELFVALPGENVDGHDFIAQAQQRGACAVLTSKACDSDLPQVQVADTLRSLGMLASAWQQRFSVPCVGITGSNGKTTTRHITGHILQQHSSNEAVLLPQKNYNSLSGLPLTLFRLNEQHRYIVLELAMNRAGEIAQLTQICQPHIALITQAAPAHLHELGSVAAVAKAKGEIFENLPNSSTAIINADDDFATYWQGLLKGQPLLRFGLNNPKADVNAQVSDKPQQFVLQTPVGSIPVSLQLPGLHNIQNAVAAASIAIALDVPLETIASGIANVQAYAQRMQRKAGKRGACIIDDTYNANLRSSQAAIHTLAQLPGKKVLVFGDMGELGASSTDMHTQVGTAAQQAELDALFTLGEHSLATHHAFDGHKHHFHDKAALLDALQNWLNEDTAILVKGSRFMRMEDIVNAITNEPEETN